MPESQIEFAVQMTCDSCVEAVKKSLQDNPGISSFDVNLEKGSVVVNTTLPTLQIQEKLESTGRKVVVRGYAGSSAGVAIIDNGKADIQGVVRFVQVKPDSCIIDGTIDGLESGADLTLTVHECGDISQGGLAALIDAPTRCASVGDAYGDLGAIEAEKSGRASFKKETDAVKLSDIIGRSLVINSGEKRLACGIIARSAGLFQNDKTICACDGITIWNEKIPPKSVL